MKDRMPEIDNDEVSVILRKGRVVLSESDYKNIDEKEFLKMYGDYEVTVLPDDDYKKMRPSELFNMICAQSCYEK